MVSCSCSIPNLSFGFGIALENPQFVTCYDVFEKNFVIFNAFKKVQAYLNLVFLSFIGEVLQNQLCTNFLLAEFLGQNVVDSSVIKIQLTTDHSNFQTSIIPNDSPHLGHIFIHF